jgi:hypothetical protein
MAAADNAISECELIYNTTIMNSSLVSATEVILVEYVFKVILFFGHFKSSRLHNKYNESFRMLNIYVVVGRRSFMHRRLFTAFVERSKKRRRFV